MNFRILVPACNGALVLIGVLAVWQPGASMGESRLPEGFAYLRDIDPTITQDIKYAGADNFTGRPLPGYDAAACVLRRSAAEALRRVQQDLAPQGLSLKVYDCYRPVRAVGAMMDWASAAGSGDESERFFPRLEKSQLALQGYIARNSTHSRGTAVDLTLIRASGSTPRGTAPELSNSPCTESKPSGSLDPDMGTSFDCFDVKSHTASPLITPDQRRWRSVLARAMAKHGFKNYPREWWHFTFAGDSASRAHDFSIEPGSAPK